MNDHGGSNVLQSLKQSILLLFFAVVMCCGVYPLALWVVGQTFFPFQANGSMVSDETGKIIGSLLIAQSFSKAEYFQPRPSAASYDASASSSSALAASNNALRKRVADTIDKWRHDHPSAALQDVPGDMVTTSASGLDPHITLQNALYQLDSVAKAWSSRLKRPVNDVKNEIVQLLNEKTFAPLNGLAGESMINVLEVNLELQKRYGASRPSL